MDSQPPPQSTPPAPETEPKELVYRTKVIQFLGRTTPIILQNDNGPCPLLAICNILSLKNSLNLSPDISEVSQEKLLSLVAERLIDSNSNLDGKDSGYVENQQQNIADAIDLLPRLTTGIDVNLKFRRIDDFEFTRECAIFDLLDIPLYHGWIVDSQDIETADAIGTKSYNTLMSELVSLETQTTENKNTEDDSVDFVAATTAALGVPSPCLSRGQSFDESSYVTRKGDIEEEAELLRVLKISEEARSLEDAVVSDNNLQENANTEKFELANPETADTNVTNEIVKIGALISDGSNELGNNHVDLKSPKVVPLDAVSPFSKTGQEILPKVEESIDRFGIVAETTGSDPQVADKNVQTPSFGQKPPSASDSTQEKSRSDEHVQDEFKFISDPNEPKNLENGLKERDSSCLLTFTVDLDSFSTGIHKTNEPEALSSSVDQNEPIYEGEECIMESGAAIAYDNQEPIYEGEVVLAEQVDRGCMDDGDFKSKDRISYRQGELIRNFMKSSASQLTVYGLFCLQDQVKERELCVFFRNNHFNTMFKYEGDLYILATDQGYINQPDLVWEKLNEVNGDTLFMMGNFKEFKIDDYSNTTWNEQSTMANTSDYLSSIDGAGQGDSSFNTDLQLAMALQEQEYEEQQQERQRKSREPAEIGSSRLVTGPQVPRTGGSGKHMSSSSKQDSKAKEKCTLM